MRAETWDKKVEALGEHIARVRDEKRARSSARTNSGR
jgi:hypothetical protein